MSATGGDGGEALLPAMGRRDAARFLREARQRARVEGGNKPSRRGKKDKKQGDDKKQKKGKG